MTEGGPERTDDSAGRAAMWRPVAGGLTLVAIALAIDALNGFGFRLALTHWLQQLARAGAMDSEALFQRMNFYNRLSSILGVISSGLVVVGLVKMVRAPSPRTRRILIGATALFAVAAMYDVLYLIASFTDEPIRWLDARWLHIAFVLDWGLGYGVLLWALARLARDAQTRVAVWAVGLVGLWIAWWVARPILTTLDPRLVIVDARTWGGAIFLAATRSGGAVVLVYLAIRSARALDRLGGGSLAGSGEPLAASGWQAPADGLRLYGNALAWRLGLILSCYTLLLLAISGKSIGLVKLVTWALPVAGLITGLAMTIGVYRFSQQPAPSRGRGSAYTGFAAMVISLALEAYGFVLVLKALTADPRSYAALEAAQRAAEEANRLSVWAMAVGFGGLLALLLSFAGVVRYVGREALVPRVINVAITLLLAAGVAVGFRIYLEGAKDRIEPTGVIVMGLVVAGYALFAVLFYLGLTRKVERAIREAVGGTADELPAARVVRDR